MGIKRKMAREFDYEVYFKEKEDAMLLAESMVKSCKESEGVVEESIKDFGVICVEDDVAGKEGVGEIERVDPLDMMLRDRVSVALCKGVRCNNAECVSFPDKVSFIMKMDTPPHDRLHILHSHCTHDDGDFAEVLMKIKQMYLFSSVVSLKEFMILIVSRSKIIPVLEKLLVVDMLDDVLDLEVDMGDTDEEREDIRKSFGKQPYQYLNKLMKTSDFCGLSAPIRIHYIFKLLNVRNVYQEGLKHLGSFVRDNSVSNDYRYKIILSLEKNVSNEKLRDRTILKMCRIFFHYSRNMTRYRLFASQYIFRLEHSELEKTRTKDVLMSFMTDTELCHELRADTADILLQFGDDDTKGVAREFLEMLGGGRDITLYDNKENVHNTHVEESAQKNLERLMSMPIGEDYIHTFEGVVKTITEYLCGKYGEGVVKLMKGQYFDRMSNTSDDEDNLVEFLCEKDKLKDVSEGVSESVERVLKALYRINIDRIIHSKLSVSLKGVLVKVWNYAVKHPTYSEDIKSRLVEELDDMSNTCFSGYIERLVNTLSGYDDFGITISFEDQLISVFKARLNSYIQSLDDDEVKSKILEQVTLKTWHHSDRKDFLDVMRVFIPKMRVELYDEFKDYMSDTDFDLTIRKAIHVYETGVKLL